MTRNRAGLRQAAMVLLTLALPACEKGAAEIVQEIDAARGGCTEELLRARDEECIRMMERYIEMGSEAMESYIGAVRSLDAALQRGDPIAFDTTGLGHAVSPGLLGGTSGDGGAGLAPVGPSFSRSGTGAAGAWGGAGDGVDRRGGGYSAWGDDPRRYGAQGGGSDRSSGGTGWGSRRGGGFSPGYGAPYDERGGYDPRYGYPQRPGGSWDSRYPAYPPGPGYDARDPYASRYGYGYGPPPAPDPRDPYGYSHPSPYDPRYRQWERQGEPPLDAEFAEEEEYDERWDLRPDLRARHPYDPERAPPSRGTLRPPEERLRREGARGGARQ